MPETPKALNPKHSRIISTVLSPALRLWLRSQVEQVEALQFNIVGGDRQILGGYIPTVSISASRAVYQGLHLGQIQLEAKDIRINLGQVLKGKPLRLLEPVPVEGQLLLAERDLQASLQSPLLSSALTELLDTFLQADGTTSSRDDLKGRQITWEKVDIDAGQLTLFGTQSNAALDTTAMALPYPSGTPTPSENASRTGNGNAKGERPRFAIVIRAGLELATPRELRLYPLQIQIHPDKPPLNLDGFQIDLGSETDLWELTLTPGQLACRGRLTVIPLADG